MRDELFMVLSPSVVMDTIEEIAASAKIEAEVDVFDSLTAGEWFSIIARISRKHQEYLEVIV